jgi:DNA polymerase-4
MQGVGVGRKLAEKFRSLGIRTASDLGQAPIDLLCAHFGVVGYHFKDMGRGEDFSPVKTYGESSPAKSFGHSHTLPRDSWDQSVIRSYLLMLSEKVGTRLREAGLAGRTESLTVRYADFHTFSKQQNLKQHIQSSGEIYACGVRILETLMPLP